MSFSCGRPILYVLSLAVVLALTHRGYDEPRPPQPTAALKPKTALPSGSSISTAPTPKEFPPLHIESSGRLPASLQGFALGMGLEDATLLHPGLTNEFGGGAPFLDANGEASVCLKSPQGIPVFLEFAGGNHRGSG